MSKHATPRTACALTFLLAFTHCLVAQRLVAQRLVAQRLVARGLAAQDPVRALPRNYQTALENDYVQIVRVRYAPHEKLPLHDHSQRPTVYIYLTDSGPVRFSHVEEHSFALTRHPVKAGEFRVSPGRLEKHEVENLGDIPTEFLRIELKRLPLGLDSFQFRGNKDIRLTRTTITGEFASPQISVQRMVLAAPSDAQSIQTVRPVLFVALSPALIEAPSSPTKLLHLGDLYWLNPKQSLRVTQTGVAPTHLLLMTFLQ